MEKRRFSTPEELAAYREELWEKYTYRFGGFQFRWVTGDVLIGTETAHLTEAEADVLKVLIEAWPRPLTLPRLVQALSVSVNVQPETAKVYVSRIRRKIGIPEVIRAHGHGYGYAFNPEAVM